VDEKLQVDVIRHNYSREEKFIGDHAVVDRLNAFRRVNLNGKREENVNQLLVQNVTKLKDPMT